MKPVKVPGFTGINNRAPDDRLPKDQSGKSAVRDAVNVDLTEVGTFQRRPGSERIVTGSNVRSLTSSGGYGYYASGASLYRFDGVAPSESVAQLASAFANVCYAETPNGLAWSDGFTLNLIRGGSTARLVPAMPNPAPLCVGQAGGSLREGMYAVCFATVLASGLRSALTEPAFVQVPENGRIRLTMAALAATVDVFVTAPDGDIFYRDRTLPIGTTLQDLSVITSSGEPVVHEVTASLPPADILAYHNGRLLSAQGQFVRYSLPYSLGLYKPGTGYIPFPDPVTLVAAVEGGVYMATAKKTWFFPGGDVSKAEMAEVAPYGATPGTLATIPNSKDVTWFSPRGPVRAGIDGSITLLQDKQIAFAPADSGASIYRETNGLRTLITALSGSSPGSGTAAFGCYMTARSVT